MQGGCLKITVHTECVADEHVNLWRTGVGGLKLTGPRQRALAIAARE